MKKQIGLFTAILFAVSTLMMACKQKFIHIHLQKNGVEMNQTIGMQQLANTTLQTAKQNIVLVNGQ